MAKTRHNNYIDTVVKVLDSASERGVIFLNTEDDFFTGRHFKINGKQHYHLGTTGYLGLEQDIRLKRAAADAVMKFGTQFPLSKTYIAHSAYSLLEKKLEEMYGYPVVVTKNSTLGHLGVIPTVVRDEDAVILDHQVHWSVQNACQIAKNRGVLMEMIRHNDMDMLEEKIRKLSSKVRHIWYFADGIYSMFGDVAPIDKLKAFCEKYPQLYLYFDDVHGMSWVGKNGTGYVISQYDELPQNVIVFTTLSKTFGASGATMVTANQEFHHNVKRFGGPLTFSAQLEPSAVAAAIASADIHLSDEIYKMQEELADRVSYCNKCLEKTDLPLIEKNDCPVFYIGTGAPAVGYNFVKKLMDAGFYVNLGVFPAVAVKRTGVRFTISRHNEKEDIQKLVNAMEELYPMALAEESYTKNQVRRIFNLPLLDEAQKLVVPKNSLEVSVFNTTSDLNGREWDDIFGGNNIMNFEGLQFLESAFKNNPLPEHKWDFRFLLIHDQLGKVVLATFFTKALWKEDMLAPASVSIEMEKKRSGDPLYHTSQVLGMGSLFTEGDHLYLDHTHEQRDEALKLMFQTITRLDEELTPEMIVLRDFAQHEEFLGRMCNEEGFVTAALPESCVVHDVSWSNQTEYVQQLSTRSRKHFRRDIEPYINMVSVVVSSSLIDEEVERAFQLYNNVWEKNYDVNTFSYPKSVFQQMVKHDGWEFIKVYPAGEKDASKIVGVMFAYKNQSTYVPSLVGMDYDFTDEFSIYRQLLNHTVLRAMELHCDRIDFGFSASFEKKKIGAKTTPKIAYIQAKDNFSMEMMEVVQKE